LRYVQLRDDEGGLTVRRSVEAPSGDDLAGIAAAAEPSIAPMRKGLELLALARKHDSVVPEFAEAVALLRQALKTDPSNLHAASELVDAYLAVSDRTRDPEGSDDIHSKVLGALLFLGRLDPDHPSIPLASGILAYRFLNYPHAVEHLKRAGGDRAQEILGLLRQTGQGEYRKTGTRDLDGLQVEAYERVRRPDAEEKGLEGLQLVERCFVGAKGGAYRFTAAYRVQKLGETISRELLLNRFERSYRVRAFDAEPTEEDLAGEVGRAVQSLKGGK
jgi:tetratricopeptide (TPR) repeat protein